MKTESEELKLRIEKLPAWAKEHIEGITRERDRALRDQHKYLDNQTESPFFVQYEGPDHDQKRFIQTHSICVKWRGVTLVVDAHDFGNTGPGIRLHWEGGPRIAEVAFIPQTHQSARLVCKEDMD